MFAIVSYKGNQYKLEEGKTYEIAFTEDAEKSITFSDVLLVDDGKEVKIGEPFVKDASVEAEVLGTVRGEKVESMKFKRKVRYTRRLGHREDYTQVKVSSIKA